MNKASPVDLKKCLEAANMLAQLGIRFVPMPAATDSEFSILSAMFMDKLEALAVEAEKKEGGAS
ncbi:DUF1382 family protein [Cronobacter sakazakii]|nr:DUF1382 family protein [Cronobacter sakazakii]ELY4028066.1 DUF1382 family protein [Cronobacter sakazakii]